MEEKKSIRQEELLKEEGAGTSENHKKTSISKYAIIFILLLALFSAGAYCAIQYYAGKKFREKLDTVTMGTELSVKWKKVRYGIISGDLSVSGVMVSYKYVDMNIDSVTISDISSLPSSISLKIKNIYIKMPPEFGNKFRINPSILAIDTIRGSMSIHLSNDGEFTKMFVDEAHFENIGSFRGTLVLGEMKKWPQSLKYMMSVPIKEGSFTFTDEGLARMVMTMFAMDTSSTPEKVKSRILDGLNRRIHANYKTEGSERAMLTQAYRFFDHPNMLSVRLITDRPVTLRELVPENVMGWRTFAMWFALQPYIITSS